MPQFIACPACGCRVQMVESMIGKSVCCIACDHRFVASSPAEAETQRVEPLPARERPPVAPARPMPPPYSDPDDRPPRDADLPYCPACGRRVAWEALRCAHCGAELEADLDCDRFRRRPAGRMRRDCVPHRGQLLSGMGNITVIAGGLTPCMLGIPILVALPLGITTWVMAAADLQKMCAGEMEEQGRGQTETARATAVLGVILGLFFTAGWGLMLLSRFLP